MFHKWFQNIQFDKKVNNKENVRNTRIVKQQTGQTDSGSLTHII